MTLFERLSHWAKICPDRPALQGGDHTLSYRELAQRVDRLATLLQVAGVQRLALALDNGLAWAELDLACARAGIVVIPVPGFFTPQQQAWLLESSGADTLALPAAQIPDWQAQSGASWQALTCADHLLLQRSVPEPPPLPAGTAKITYTSGTTGAPKGVCLSLRQLERVCRALAERIGPSLVERHLTLLPLATLLENLTGLYVPLMIGASSSLPPLAEVGFRGSSRLEPMPLAALLARAAPHSLVLVPELLRLLLGLCQANPALADHLRQQLRFVAVGGGLVPPALLLAARQMGLPVYEGYGLSECGSVVALNGPNADRPGTVGTLLPHLKASLAADGELLIGGGAMLGYLGEDAPPDPFPTGDLARIDEAGFLIITGRKKHVQITAFGRNFSPEWVEAQAQLEPAIARCVIFGDGLPRNIALIEPMPGMEAALPLQLAHLNARLPDYARISHWFIAHLSVEGGTLTGNGRPRRQRIQSLYQPLLDQLSQGTQP